MTALDACFAAYDAWRLTQPQLFWTDENLYGLDETETCVLRLVEPGSGFTSGAEPSCAPPEALTALSAAPPATPNAGGSAPLTNDGRDALLSGNERRGQEVTLDVR